MDGVFPFGQRLKDSDCRSHPKPVRPVATVSFLLHISNADTTDVLQDGARKQGKRAKERNEKEAARLIPSGFDHSRQEEITPDM